MLQNVELKYLAFSSISKLENDKRWIILYIRAQPFVRIGSKIALKNAMLGHVGT